MIAQNCLKMVYWVCAQISDLAHRNAQDAGQLSMRSVPRTGFSRIYRRKPRPHLRHRPRHLRLPQHATCLQPIPHPIQRLPPILIAAPGGCDLFWVWPPSDRAGQNFDRAPLASGPGTAAWRFAAPRQLGTRRGTGCTLASSIAAYLARGGDLSSACAEAKHYLSGWW